MYFVKDRTFQDRILVQERRTRGTTMERMRFLL